MSKAAAEEKRPVYVIGHKNPDTDSVCAAIAYANLKNKTEDGLFLPRKAGSLNEETRYVLNRFHVEEPKTMSQVGTQISDIAFRRIEGVSSHYSLKKAWELMKSEDSVTLPIVSPNGWLEGVIVNGDIAYSYIDILDNTILGRARTQYKNIIETLKGNMLTGNEHAYFIKGKVVVAAGDDESLRREIEENDLVILGNIKERLMIALSENPSCMIVTDVSTLPDDVIEKAKSIDCVLIATEYDSFTAARLIHQSIPIKYFMTKENLITFELDDYIDEVQMRMEKIRHRDFPVLDEKQHYVGMFSRRHLLHMRKKQVILVDHNEKSQAVDGIDEAEILEIVDHHRLGSLETIQPIMFRNQPLGCCSTIIAKMYKERGVEIDKTMAGLMLSAILSDTLMFRSPTCTEEDIKVAKELSAIAETDYRELAISMFEAGSNFKDRSTEEIFYQDFKTFDADEVSFGVAQVSAISRKQLNSIEDKLRKYMDKVRLDKNLDMIFVMLTDILEQGSYVLYGGNEAESILSLSFGAEKLHDNICDLPGVVSRKKQMVPKVIEAIQLKNDM
ncbi:MAG: putative manganese-dependent inorganic diphosphatase [Lachnospiraceae bacterium]|nr:putative manganese-dependent inorganic diphosphatase [Lachnospiraceae bacterium]